MNERVKIDAIRVRELRLPLRTPFRISGGVLLERRSWIVEQPMTFRAADDMKRQFCRLRFIPCLLRHIGLTIHEMKLWLHH